MRGAPHHALLLAGALPAADAAVNITRHEITSLPGLAGPLPSKMRNGFVNAGTSPKGDGDMFFHYWLVESERDPAKDPIVFWWQGGPGASSLFGLMQEFGPLMLNAASYDAAYNKTGEPSLVTNPWGWSKYATLVAIDNPPPTGFSYCSPAGPGGNGYSCGDWTDTKVAAANHAVLTGFFAGFPEYADNDVYIFGESYGGIYVPMIVEQVLDKPVPGMNLKGFALVDGQYPVTGHTPYSYRVDFWHGHGQFSNSLYYKIKKECNDSALRTCGPTHCPLMLPRTCQQLLDQMYDEIGGYYTYNMYDECPHSVMFKNGGAAVRGPALAARGGPAGGGPPGSSSPCPLTALIDWTTLQSTHNALGLDKTATFFDADDGEGMNYTSNHGDIKAIYTRAVKSGLRVLSINGGTDPTDTLGAGQDAFVDWASGAGLQQTQPWRPWAVDGEPKHVGGHLMEWDNGAFVWSRVRGSGHEVPEYKPKAGLTLFSHFISGTDYPRYKK